MADNMVKKTQEYLNAMYGGHPGYNIIKNDGVTGWTTIRALIRALQIELGITQTADSFGPATTQKFLQKYPNGIHQQAPDDSSQDNIYALIQGALWCKGYSTGAKGITKNFYGGTGGAVIKLKENAGLENPTSTVDLDVMKALLSMDQFVLVFGGMPYIQEIQRSLNKTYKNYVGLIPCDGIYGREMNKALIKVLQAIEGLSPEEANGNFGEYTRNHIPLLPESNNKEAIKLFKYALVCNGYYVYLDSSWSKNVESVILDFQEDYALPKTGKGDLTTWMSLFISRGNPDRKAVGCDCATILTSGKAKSLYNAGYRYVGRYLTGTVRVEGERIPKNLTKEELNIIFDAGLKVFAIYQDNTPSVEYYNNAQGKIDATLALQAAQGLGIPYNEIIYFAVDYDIMEFQVNSNVRPYFRGIREVMNSNQNKYRVGVYGSRNICTMVSRSVLAVSSFVADMSTGFSGNLGYPIPRDWAFDQFAEIPFTSSDGIFAIDKDAYSGRYSGFGHIEDHSSEEEIEMPRKEIIEDRCKYLLKLFNFDTEGTFALNKKIPVSGPPVEVTYIASAEAIIDEGEGNNKKASINITNGEFSDVEFSYSEEIYNGLETDIKVGIDDEGNLEVLTTIAKEINNGKVEYSMGLSDEGKLIFTYLIEENLWNDISVYLKVEIKISSEDGNDLSDVYQTADNLSTVILASCGVVILALILFGSIASIGGLAPAIFATATLLSI